MCNHLQNAEEADQKYTGLLSWPLTMHCTILRVYDLQKSNLIYFMTPVSSWDQPCKFVALCDPHTHTDSLPPPSPPPWAPHNPLGPQPPAPLAPRPVLQNAFHPVPATPVNKEACVQVCEASTADPVNLPVMAAALRYIGIGLTKEIEKIRQEASHSLPIALRAAPSKPFYDSSLEHLPDLSAAVHQRGPPGLTTYDRQQPKVLNMSVPHVYVHASNLVLSKLTH